MIFNLKTHRELYVEWKLNHNGPNCLCRRFRDGEEMYKPEMALPPPIDKPEVTLGRDPSQSEQPWEGEMEEVSSDEISKDEIPS